MLVSSKHKHERDHNQRTPASRCSLLSSSPASSDRESLRASLLENLQRRSKPDVPPAPSPSPQSPGPPTILSAQSRHTQPGHESPPPPHPAANLERSTHTPAAPST